MSSALGHILGIPSLPVVAAPSAAGEGAGVDNLLLESGGHLLLEGGGVLILE